MRLRFRISQIDRREGEKTHKTEANGDLQAAKCDLKKERVRNMKVVLSGIAEETQHLFCDFLQKNIKNALTNHENT